MPSELSSECTESGPQGKKAGLGLALSVCIAGVWSLSLAAHAALSPPLAEDGSRGGLGTITSWSFASNNAGRVTLPEPFWTALIRPARLSSQAPSSAATSTMPTRPARCWGTSFTWNETRPSR